MAKTDNKLHKLIMKKLEDVTEEAMQKALDELTEVMILQEKAKEGDKNAIEQLLFITGIEYGCDTYRRKRHNH
jgi:hypothetical protein